MSKRARDQALDAFGEGDLGVCRKLPCATALLQEPAVLEHPDELLRVEGVAACTLQDRRLDLGGQHGLAEELADQLRGLLFG